MEHPQALTRALQALDDAIGRLEQAVGSAAEAETARLDDLVHANAEVERRLGHLAAEVRHLAIHEAGSASAAPG